MSESANRELILRHFEEIFHRGNLAFVEEAYTEDAVIHDSVLLRIPAGPGGIRQYVRTYAGPVPDLHFEVKDLIADGDMLAAHWTATGTQVGTLLAVPSTGRVATASGVSIYRMEEGKIAEVWDYWDIIALLKSLGVELQLKATVAPQP